LGFHEIENESEILNGLAEGSESAFLLLYNGYADSVYSVALMYTKLPSIAEDIVQSVFVKVWENRGEIRNVGKFSSWLFIVARNIILSNFRKENIRKNHLTYLKERLEQGIETPEYELLKKENRKILKEAVDQLTPQQRTAFLLNREEGLTYEEIGLRMGISINTVKVHLYKGLESIRAYMAKFT
jgi:RNA polymerase sigma-70 factor (family 1)